MFAKSKMEKFKLKEIETSKVEVDYVVKTIMLGESGVGKSSLLLSLTGKPFRLDSQPTIGIDFGVKNYEMDYDGEIEKYEFPWKVKLLLWDCAGQERFRSIVKSYYRNANIIIIVFDVCDVYSFECVRGWYKSLEECSDANLLEICIVGNKTDLGNHRKVSYEAGKTLADNLGALYIETSAKDHENVQELLEISLMGLMDKVLKGEIELNRQRKNVFRMGGGSEKKETRCCFG